MDKHFNPHFNRNVVTIYPGEFWSSCGAEMISTVLGSCVSIVLFDPIARVGGMNHFLLAKESKQKSTNTQSQMHPGHFGEYAVDLLISDMEQKGAVLKRCSAKVFGGANIFNSEIALKGEMVGASNVNFAFDYLHSRGLKIENSDTGGTLPRKIFFDPSTSKVFLKHIDLNSSTLEFFLPYDKFSDGN